MVCAGGTADLALGVCAGGGIGAVGVDLTPAEQLRDIIDQIRAVTDAPFNVNFITCFDNDAQIRVCAEEKVPVASFHWGHPLPEHLRLLLDAGVSVWEQVGEAEAAKKAVGDGVEVIVAQGWEAGGHNYGGLPTMVLVPEIVDAESPSSCWLRVVSSTDGEWPLHWAWRGWGWVGTRLVATPEAAVHAKHKRRLVEGRGQGTIRSSIFGPEWPHFNPMRVLRNRVVDEWPDRLADAYNLIRQPVLASGIFKNAKREATEWLHDPDKLGEICRDEWVRRRKSFIEQDFTVTSREVELFEQHAPAIFCQMIVPRCKRITRPGRVTNIRNSPASKSTRPASSATFSTDSQMPTRRYKAVVHDRETLSSISG